MRPAPSLTASVPLPPADPLPEPTPDLPQRDLPVQPDPDQTPDHGPDPDVFPDPMQDPGRIPPQDPIPTPPGEITPPVQASL